MALFSRPNICQFDETQTVESGDGDLQKGFYGVVSPGLEIKTWIPASCSQILIQHS